MPSIKGGRSLWLMFDGGVGGRSGINKSGTNIIRANPATMFNFKPLIPLQDIQMLIHLPPLGYKFHSL